MKPELVFILVNYFNEEDMVAFVRNQLMKQSFLNFDVVVVDNGSNDQGPLNRLADELSNVFLVKSQKNLGYFGGAHEGLEKYKKSKAWFPGGVVLSNSDLEFGDPTFIEKMYHKYVASPGGIGIIGTSIYSPQTGVNQNPFEKKRISRRKLLFLKAVFSNHVIYTMYEMGSLIRRKLFTRSAHKLDTGNVEQVYAVHGSFFLLTSEFFNRGGTLNYPSFLFGEEIYLAEQALRLNLKVCFDSSLKIVHDEHSTTAAVKSKLLVSYMYDSINYLLNAYFQKQK